MKKRKLDPIKAGMDETAYVGFYIPKEMKAEIKGIADGELTSESSIMRRILQRGLKQEKLNPV